MTLPAMNVRQTIVHTCAIVLAFGSAQAAVADTPPTPAMLLSTTPLPTPPVEDPLVVTTSGVRLERQVLGQLASRTTNSFAVELPSGVRLAFDVKRVDRPAADALVLVAESAAEARAWLVLVQRRELFAGRITTVGHGDYELRPTKDSGLSLCELRGGPVICARGGDPSIVQEPPEAPNAGGWIAGSCNPDDGSVIDVLVVYTDAISQSVGEEQARLLIELKVAETNAAFERSGISTRFRLVDVRSVDYVEGLNESCSTTWIRLESPSDGYLDEVHAWRNEAGVDLIAIWRRNFGLEAPGASNIPTPQGFRPIASVFAALGDVPIHEWGHNLGCCHAVGDGGGCDGGFFSYSNGFRFDPGCWGDIMAYDGPCSFPQFVRLPYFSTPLRSYQGVPIGVPADQPGAADNVRTINELAPMIAGYRFSRFEDCNNNGDHDLCDIRAGLSADCNQNFVPDECETVAFIPPGAFALEFDGNDDYVAVGDPAALDISGPTTLEAWVRLPSTLDSGVHTIIHRRRIGGAPREVFLRIDNGEFVVGDDTREAAAAVPASDLGRWVHLAGVADEQRWTLYRNGIWVADRNDNDGAPSFDGPWLLGAAADNAGQPDGNYFAGSIDEVRMWSLARTAQQIQSAMHTPLAGNDSGLAAYWRMEEGSGTLLNSSASPLVPGVVHGAGWAAVSPDTADCNHNGVPDSCEPDLDGDGVPDECQPVVCEATSMITPEPPGTELATDFGGSTLLADGLAYVGAMREFADGRAGAVRVFELAGTRWRQVQRIGAPDPAYMDDPVTYFGSRMTVAADLLVVGAHEDGEVHTNAGAAYVFRHDGVEWLHEGKLLPTDDGWHPFDGNFGRALSIADGDVVAGAPWALVNGAGAGAAYVFRYKAGVWALQQRLESPQPAASNRFGESLLFTHGTLLVAEPRGGGQVWMFERSAGTWALIGPLVPPDAAGGFGHALASDREWLAVGAPDDDAMGGNAGAVYLYRRSAGEWVFTTKLHASDASVSARFGVRVVLSGDVMLVGRLSSKAYVFRHDGAQWTEVGQLTNPTGDTENFFPSGLALEGDTAIVGAPGQWTADGPTGAAFVFRGLAGDCNQNGQLDACDIIGGGSPDANRSGLPDECEGGIGDANCNGAVDFFDIDPFILALFDPAGYAAAFPACDRADTNGDGNVDFFDIDPFVVCLFSGCP